MIKEQFIKQIHKQIEVFSLYIDKLNAEQPENAITDLEEPDWFEQFEMFIALR